MSKIKKVILVAVTLTFASVAIAGGCGSLGCRLGIESGPQCLCVTSK